MKAQSGFTLIELLVSLTLLAFLFVLLLGGLRFGTRAWERGAELADAGDTVRTVQNLLRSEIERTCLQRDSSPSSSKQPPQIEFSGSATALRFLAPAAIAAGGKSCVLQTLRVRSDGTLTRLSLADGETESDLLRHVQSVTFAYRSSSGAWLASWTRQSDLPVLIRVRATFVRGDDRIWPELFVSPRISAEADCTYDPATKSCRGP